MDEKDSRPFDGAQGRERVERVPGLKGSSEIIRGKNYIPHTMLKEIKE